MIKINLLPRTINEKKIIRNTAILFGILLVAIIVGGITFTRVKLAPEIDKWSMKADAAEAIQTEVTKIEGERDAELAKLPPIKAKSDFINNVHQYNTEYPKLYEEIAKWTYDKVCYVALVCDGTQVAIKARVKSLDDLGRFLLNMYRATDLFTEVAISGVPGYQSSQQNSGGVMSMDMPTPGMPSPGAIPYSAPDMPAPGAAPSASMAGIGAINTSVENAPKTENYIEFTVTCKLKKPIVAPVYTAAGGAAAAGTTPPAP